MSAERIRYTAKAREALCGAPNDLCALQEDLGALSEMAAATRQRLLQMRPNLQPEDANSYTEALHDLQLQVQRLQEPLANEIALLTELGRAVEQPRILELRQIVLESLRVAAKTGKSWPFVNLAMAATALNMPEGTFSFGGPGGQTISVEELASMGEFMRDAEDGGYIPTEAPPGDATVRISPPGRQPLRKARAQTAAAE